MASTALAVNPAANYAAASLESRARYAQSLAAAKDLIPSGLRDNQTGLPNPAKILLVMETGSMLGIHPMAALQGITVIEGRATISPQLMTGLIRKAGHKVAIKREGSIERGDFIATCTITRSDDPENPITATFTPHMAARAGLCEYAYDQAKGVWVVRARSKSGKVLPWEAYPENMCVWRATGTAGREGADDVLMGVAYTPEEMGASTNDEGEVVVEDVTEREDREIAEFRKLDDKEDMREVYKRLHREEFWTDRLAAEFAAHLSTLTKDSGTPPEGAPGTTGEPTIDNPGEEVAVPVEDEDAAEAALDEYAGTFFEEEERAAAQAAAGTEEVPVTSATIDPERLAEEETWEEQQARLRAKGLL